MKTKGKVVCFAFAWFVALVGSGCGSESGPGEIEFAGVVPQLAHSGVVCPEEYDFPVGPSALLSASRDELVFGTVNRVRAFDEGVIVGSRGQVVDVSECEQEVRRGLAIELLEVHSSADARRDSNVTLVIPAQTLRDWEDLPEFAADGSVSWVSGSRYEAFEPGSRMGAWAVRSSANGTLVVDSPVMVVGNDGAIELQDVAERCRDYPADAAGLSESGLLDLVNTEMGAVDDADEQLRDALQSFVSVYRSSAEERSMRGNRCRTSSLGASCQPDAGEVGEDGEETPGDVCEADYICNPETSRCEVPPPCNRDQDGNLSCAEGLRCNNDDEAPTCYYSAD